MSRTVDPNAVPELQSQGDVLGALSVKCESTLSALRSACSRPLSDRAWARLPSLQSRQPSRPTFGPSLPRTSSASRLEARSPSRSPRSSTSLSARSSLSRVRSVLLLQPFARLCCRHQILTSLVNARPQYPDFAAQIAQARATYSLPTTDSSLPSAAHGSGKPAFRDSTITSTTVESSP